MLAQDRVINFNDTPMNLQRLFNFTPISAAFCSLCFIGIATAQTPSVSGQYIGNGKNAELKFVNAQEDEPFNDKPAIKILLSEKNPATSQDPDHDAMFGKLGSTLSLRVFHDGDIFSCQVGHTSLKKCGFSSSGEFKMAEFKIADGKISGRVSTAEECEFFGDRYQANLTFTATLAGSQSNTAAPKSGPLSAAQKAFLDGYKKALEAKDTKALASHLYTEGATPDTIDFFTMMQSTGTEGKIESIDLIQPSEADKQKYNKPTEMPDGQLYKMPFVPTHQMVIVIKDGSGGTSTSKLPVGEHKDKLLIPVPVPVNSSSKNSAKASAMQSDSKPAEAPVEQTIPTIAARSLPLPKDATNVEYKQVVKMIQFSSALSVTALAKEFAASLKGQGWKDGKGSLMSAKSTILKREQEAAQLTIMIQPAENGCAVKIFTEGLDWSAAGDAPPPATKKPATVPTADELEGHANKALQDALKNLPKGLRF